MSPPCLLYTSSLHGSAAAGEYRELVHNVSCGDTSRWQANARGVDLNHNFNAGWEALHTLEQEQGIYHPCLLYTSSTSIIVFSVLLLIVAILTKIVGCGLGAKMCRYSNAEALQIGCGMISRGEVALIVANKGAALGLMSTTFFGPIIITVVATTIIAPILLKLVFRSKKKADGQSAVEAEEKSPLAEGLAEIYEYSQAAKTAPEEEEPESIIKKKKSESKKNS